MCKRTPMPLDWMHTGGGGPGSWPSPVDRSSHGPVYGLPPRSTRWAFSWRPLWLRHRLKNYNEQNFIIIAILIMIAAHLSFLLLLSFLFLFLL